MRIIRLNIERHLMLRDLEISFDRPGRLEVGNYALDFLVGVNGSGKSTILRVLAKIFSNLQAGRTTEFNYLLEYEIGDREIPIRVTVQLTRDDGKPVLRMLVPNPDTENPIPLYDSNAIDEQYLPNNIIIYTTGSEAEWQLLLEKTQESPLKPKAPEKTIDDVIEREMVELPGHLPVFKTEDLTEVEQTILLIQASRLNIMTLCGLLVHFATSSKTLDLPLTDVLLSTGIQRLSGFSLKFRLHSALSDYSTFENLQPLANRHIQQGADHLLVFDLMDDQQQKASEIIGEFGGSLNLFKELDLMMQISLSGEPTLQQVNIFIERNTLDIEDPVTKNMLFDWLSDGEQSFLGRMALLVMLDTENSLIMLDEPEVHFNDYWKREIINLVDHVMSTRSNHLLITTHSSIVLSDVTEAHVIALARGEDGISRRQFIRVPLLAVDPSEIMVNWFGTERSVGQRATRLLSEAVERGDIDELEKLLGLVGPGFWRYRIQDRLEELRATPG